MLIIPEHHWFSCTIKYTFINPYLFRQLSQLGPVGVDIRVYISYNLCMKNNGVQEILMSHYRTPSAPWTSSLSAVLALFFPLVQVAKYSSCMMKCCCYLETSFFGRLLRLKVLYGYLMLHTVKYTAVTPREYKINYHWWFYHSQI